MLLKSSMYLVNSAELHMLVFDTDLFAALLRQKQEKQEKVFKQFLK